MDDLQATVDDSYCDGGPWGNCGGDSSRREAWCGSDCYGLEPRQGLWLIYGDNTVYNVIAEANCLVINCAFEFRSADNPTPFFWKLSDGNYPIPEYSQPAC